jgi:hypothetical protein
MDSSFDTYQWVKQNGIWKLESTSEDGKKTLLPEGVVPIRAPCRFDEIPDYQKWKKSQGESKDSGSEISAR